jgi:transcriptional regulator with XRE-family HTH domain
MKSEEQQQIIVFVVSLRNVVEMTQAEFADTLGVSRSYISALESGFRPINVSFLIAVRKRFGISIDALFDGLNF